MKHNTALVILISVITSIAMIAGMVFSEYSSITFPPSGSAPRREIQKKTDKHKVERTDEGQEENTEPSAAVTDKPQSERCYQEVTDDQVVIADNGTIYVDSQILLIASENASLDELVSLVGGYGGRIVGYIALTGDCQVEFTQKKTYEELLAVLEEIRESPLVEMAVLHKLYETSEESSAAASGEDGGVAPVSCAAEDLWLDNSSDAADDYQQGLFQSYHAGNAWWAGAVNIPYLWPALDDGSIVLSPVDVGVLDTPVDGTHPDVHFEELLFAPAVNEQEHATHVSGLIAARGNDLGIRGVSPNARLYSAALLSGIKKDEDADPEPYDRVSSLSSLVTSDFIEKLMIVELLERGVKVINMSIGEPDLSMSAYYDSEILHLTADESFALEDLQIKKRIWEVFINRCSVIYPHFLLVKSAGNESGQYFVETGGGHTSDSANSEFPYSLRNSVKNEREASGAVASDFVHMPMPSQYDYVGCLRGTSAYDHVLIVGSVDLYHSVQLSSGWIPYSADGAGKYLESSFSAKGADIYAPGGTEHITVRGQGNSDEYEYMILSTVPGTAPGMASTDMLIGTSMAAPVVSGVAALVWGYNPGLSARQVKECLTDQRYAAAARKGWTNAQLPMVDALAALKMADLLGEDTGLHGESVKDLAIFSGFGYTADDDEGFDTGDIFIPVDTRVMLYDSQWNEKYRCEQDGWDNFGLLVKPGTYYIRVISELENAEYIGEITINANDYVYKPIRLKNRPAAMYDFACYQSTKSGEWYESGEGTISANLVGFGADLDYVYDMHVTGYEPEDHERTGVRAEGTGTMSEYGMGVYYNINYEGGKTRLQMNVMGISMNEMTIEIDPGLFDFESVKEEHLTNVLEIEDDFFTVELSEEQLSTLRLNALFMVEDLSEFGLTYGILAVEMNPDMSLNGIGLYAEGSASYAGTVIAEASFELYYYFSDEEIGINTGVPEGEISLEDLFGGW